MQALHHVFGGRVVSRKSRKRGAGRARAEARRREKSSKILGKGLPSRELPSTRNIMDVAEGEFRVTAEVVKVDEELGLVMGWAIVSTIDGKPYFDKQGDHIPDESMLHAATDFMLNSRIAGEMHKDEGDLEKVEDRGSVVFAFPMTAEVASSFGIVTKKTGLMIAMRPDEEMLEKFREGELTGFSIGGKRGDDEEVV